MPSNDMNLLGCGVTQQEVQPQGAGNVSEPVGVLSDSEWLVMFPLEVKELAVLKLIELEPEAKRLKTEIKDSFREASRCPENLDVWLVHDYATEQSLVPRLLEVEKQIKRFKWLSKPLNQSKKAISNVDIDHARQTPLEAIMGLQFKPAGSGKLKALCPFHPDRSPSLIVFPGNHYHCFSCGKHGSPIDYVMETENKSFIEAVKALRGIPTS